MSVSINNITPLDILLTFVVLALFVHLLRLVFGQPKPKNLAPQIFTILGTMVVCAILIAFF